MLWGSAPDPEEGVYSTPGPLLYKGLKGGRRAGKNEKWGRKVKGRKVDRRWRVGLEPANNLGVAPLWYKLPGGVRGGAPAAVAARKTHLVAALIYVFEP